MFYHKIFFKLNIKKYYIQHSILQKKITRNKHTLNLYNFEFQAIKVAKRYIQI